ncbi:MAG: hypothetical protein AAGC44_07250 [Planctomycetota bacterium]
METFGAWLLGLSILSLLFGLGVMLLTLFGDLAAMMFSPFLPKEAGRKMEDHTLMIANHMGSAGWLIFLVGWPGLWLGGGLYGGNADVWWLWLVTLVLLLLPISHLLRIVRGIE